MNTTRRAPARPISKTQLEPGDIRRGPFLAVQNASVVHSRKGWTNAEARDAVTDARRGVLYSKAPA